MCFVFLSWRSKTVSKKQNKEICTEGFCILSVTVCNWLNCAKKFHQRENFLPSCDPLWLGRTTRAWPHWAHCVHIACVGQVYKNFNCLGVAVGWEQWQWRRHNENGAHNATTTTVLPKNWPGLGRLFLKCWPQNKDAYQRRSCALEHTGSSTFWGHNAYLVRTTVLADEGGGSIWGQAGPSFLGFFFLSSLQCKGVPPPLSTITTTTTTTAPWFRQAAFDPCAGGLTKSSTVAFQQYDRCRYHGITRK